MIICLQQSGLQNILARYYYPFQFRLIKHFFLFFISETLIYLNTLSIYVKRKLWNSFTTYCDHGGDIRQSLC